MNELIRRLRYLLNRRRLDQELAADLEFHREMAERDGHPFGHTLRLREEARDAWGWTWIERFSQDLRYAARILGKSPGFTATAVLILALGVGVNVAGFGFFNLMFLRPLPVPDPGTLLQFDRQNSNNFSDNFVYPEVAYFAEHAKELSAVLAVNLGALTTDGEEKRLHVAFVTANYFTELGGSAVVGRLFDSAADAIPSAAPVVVLGFGFWQHHFGADPAIAGKTIHLDGKPATVIGVASAKFSGLGSGTPELWAPIMQKPYYTGGGQSLSDFSDGAIGVFMWGRLHTGVTPRAAEAELASLAAQLRRQYPKDIWEKETLPSKPGAYAMSARAEMYPVFALAGALGILILAATCTSLGNLQLAQGIARAREMAIRASLGAGRNRLIRQLFTESLLLALLGSIAGLMVGCLLLKGLILWTEGPAWLSPSPDWRLAAFTLATGFAAAILFGLAPAWQAARVGRRTTKLRQILIGAQLASSCVLLIVAALLVRALHHAASTPPGFEYEHIVTIDPNFAGYSPTQAKAYFETLNRRLSSMPGVASVSLVSNPPLGNRWTVVKTNVAGHDIDVHFNNVDPTFFQTMNIALLRGRNLARGDQGAVVVSESLARLEWPGDNPIGKPFRVTLDSAGTAPADIVVGVSGNARLVSPEDSDAVEVYRLAKDDLLPQMVVLVRTSGPSGNMTRLVGAIAKSVDPKLFPDVQRMKVSFEGKVQQARYAALAVSLLGLVALLLACVGIVGLISYTVRQRTKEIGIRLALGAKPAQVLLVVLRQFSYPFVSGLLFGTGVAAALSQVLRRELYGISNLDPGAYLAAVGVLILMAILAALLPAARSLRVDPVLALRYD